jgi:hypothetical protein
LQLSIGYCQFCFVTQYAVLYRTFHPSSGLDMLKVQVVSQAQAWQRCGRAGRDAPGTCYRLYTEDDFDHMPPNTTPELLRLVSYYEFTSLRLATSLRWILILYAVKSRVLLLLYDHMFTDVTWPASCYSFLC